MHRFRWPAGVALAAVAVFGVLSATASSSRVVTKAITPSPAWTAAQLGAPAGNNWLEYYGSLDGSRYSSLNQITTSNVGTLKEVWHNSLGTCTPDLIAGKPVIPGAPNGAPNNTTNCGSMESNPVAVDGVLYTTNAPLGEVFAIDAATGTQIWKWTPSYAGEILNNGSAFTPGSGGRRAGVAVGEGLVFNGLPDGRLVAINQVTGQLAWETAVGSYKNNAKISSAPIYVNGMVLAGDGSGDSGGNSPSLQAFRAANGARIWTWSPIPSPGQPGYKTWTNDGKGGNGSTLYGGGSFWESPVVDVARGIITVGTGNPEPWNTRGPGQNLYTDSIVGLDLYTGQLKWYFQQVHHDLWDSDLPNNGVMFDGKFKVNGKLVTRPAVAYVNKVGMTFVIDRVTGKPLIPVKETKVPQNHSDGVNTWPTQPVPATQNVLFNPIGKDGIPCTSTDAVTSLGTPFATATAPDGKPYKIGCAYTPYDTTQYTVMPFEMMDWPASSYSPQNHTMITCGVTGRATAMEQIPAASQVASTFGGLGANRLGVSDGSTPISNSGNFTALNVETGKLTFHQHWPAICYSGSANTAGGVTFVGHFGTGDGSKGDGYLEAVNTKTGASLWTSPTMPYPVSAAPITYTVNGKQYVTVEVGGAGHNDVTRPFGLLDPRRVRGDYVYTFAVS
ncbi:MAG: quinonprotein alcohol dehydrogenase [Actinomycetia bacterium]|nr:quinonprotein alcohol dehydrogenase [Actinomycetes bacterium]